jgi:hypothetical protein
MTDNDEIRRTARINQEIVITHGLEGGVGFLWRETFIHNPFADPQYGAFLVDPVQQYGDAYSQSIFATDSAKALELAQHQLRVKASNDLSRYCMDNDLDPVATIDSICGVRVHEVNHLTSLTDEQVARLWLYVDGEFANL